MSDLQLLDRRVTAVERESEKLVTRQFLEPTQRDADERAAIRSRLEVHDMRFDSHDARFDRLEAEIRSLRSDLPGIVAERLREALRERERQGGATT